VRSLSRAATAIGLAGFAVAALLGAVLGLRLGASASEPGVQELVLTDPAFYAGPPSDARISVAGFTGFGAPALAGEVIAGGEVVSVAASDEGGGTLVFRDGDRETALQYVNASRLYELVGDASLAAGDSVVVRVEDDAVAGVLVVPSGLAESAVTPEE
jgi:hypothetical protein